MSDTSPVLLSEYDPSGQFFAYVTEALDKQRVSVEPTNISKTSLTNDNFLYLEVTGVTCTCLKWININMASLVALGLSNGEIWLYSPLANEIVTKLQTGDSLPVIDLQISEKTNQAWCLDGNDTIYMFDMSTYNLSSKFTMEECRGLRKLCIVDDERVLLASHQIFLVNIHSKTIMNQYPGHISPVCFLQISPDTSAFVSASKDDRFLNVYDLETSNTKAVLVAHSNVTSVATSVTWQCFSITTEDGELEVFENPLIVSTNTSKRRSGKISKASNKTVNLVRKSSNLKLPMVNSFVQNDVISFCWLENATVPYFDQIKWDSLEELATVIAKPLPAILSSQKSNIQGSDVASATIYKEGNATTISGDNFRHVESLISSLAQTEEDELSESLQDKLQAISQAPKNTKDRKRATAGTSAVVLSQALKSNDHSLLESVLNTRDEKVIQATITRLSPQLATILLERLAERIARQTHRQGPLNVWVKWCLVIHGGYLVTMPNLMSSLSSLHSTLKRRADLLPKLMALETRLNSCLDDLDNKRYAQYGIDKMNNPNPGDYAYDGEDKYSHEDEDEVEYIEELDDAGLIEDAEGYEYSSENEESDGDQQGAQEYTEDGFEDDEEMKVHAEDGYSDVEI